MLLTLGLAPLHAQDAEEDRSALEARLLAVPLIPERFSPRLYDIFQDGQANGQLPNAFVKLGDCNTESGSFLMPYDGEQGTYNLGPYTDLQASIDFFAGSFARRSVAAHVGFNVITVQDPTWADPAQCKPNEAPIHCEYRLMRPSFAIIMFGANDVRFLTPAQYETYTRALLEHALSQGTIPILTTFTHRPSDETYTKALRLNLILVELAEAYDIPLINFWRAARDLPDYGIAEDNAHLSRGSKDLNFTGDEAIWGYPLRNLLTLQTLEALRVFLALGEN
jgi:hypothetical protein